MRKLRILIAASAVAVAAAMGTVAPADARHACDPAACIDPSETWNRLLEKLIGCDGLFPISCPGPMP